MPLPLQSQEYCFIPILTPTKLVAQKNVSAPSYAAALALTAAPSFACFADKIEFMTILLASNSFQ